MSDFDIILDNSKSNLKEVPIEVLQMHNLKMLYLQQNFIKELPTNFFQSLPQLNWLDLRSNHLKTIPKNVAHHQNLENLLLADNKIEELPNELGLVPQLKVLQVGNNPLRHPNSVVVSGGTKKILEFLRKQLETPPVSESESEREILVENYSDTACYSKPVIKSLSTTSGIVHKVSSSTNKTIVHSYSEDPSQPWMKKLKELLDQQEKILQQERNLQALSSWREEKQSQVFRNVEYKSEPPFATSLLSREDLHKEIEKHFGAKPPKRKDVERLISDLVSQLKDMEVTYDGLKSPRSEIEAAGSQIIKIMEMHKKLVKLRDSNDVIL